MTIEEAHYQFRLSMDRIDTLSNPDFNKAEVDWLLNEAQDIFIKQRISALSNPKRLGFEASQKRIDDLSTLVVKYPLQPAITPTLDSGVYEVDLAELLYTYLHFLSGYCDLQVDATCTKQVLLKFVQHDDYREALSDPFNSPSLEYIPFNYGRSSSTDHVSTSIYIYPSDYTITNVYLEYLKRPQRVSFGNYTYINGVVYPATTFELPEHTHSEIIDIATQIASLAIENPEYIQLRNQKVFSHE